MHHVIKGITVIRVDHSVGYTIKNNVINNVENLSVEPFTGCSDYHKDLSTENVINNDVQQMGNIRAISVAATRGYKETKYSKIKKNTIKDISSSVCNFVIGIDVQGDSEGVSVTSNTVSLTLNGPLPSNGSYLSCRVRENTEDSMIVMKRNSFTEEASLLNHPRRRKLQVHGHLPFNHPHFDHLEWPTDEGCPFARG